MLSSLGWFVAVALLALLALLALYYLAAWALNAAAVWTVSNAGALSDAASGAVTVLALWVPLEIAQWVSQMLVSPGPAVDSLLPAASASVGGVAVAAWAVWPTGSALLLMLGAGMHLLFALWRHRGSGDFAPNAGRSLAAG